MDKTQEEDKLSDSIYKEYELPEIPKTLPQKKAQEVYNIVQTQFELMVKYALSQCSEYKKQRTNELNDEKKKLAALKEQIIAIERILSKEESRLSSLKFQEQGREKSMKHLEEVIKDTAKETEEAVAKQREYEEEQSYNRATQMKLLQGFDQKMHKKIKDYLNSPEGDPTLKGIASLFVALLRQQPTSNDGEVKDAFSDYKKLLEMMQDPKLEVISSVDEKEYFKAQEIFIGKLAQFGNDKTQLEQKDLCTVLLHFVAFTIGISMAKRNLGRAFGRLEKMQRDYIDKEAEYAKKVIHLTDPKLIKFCEGAVNNYKITLILLNEQKKKLEEKVGNLEKEVAEYAKTYFGEMPKGATNEQAIQLCNS